MGDVYVLGITRCVRGPLTDLIIVIFFFFRITTVDISLDASSLEAGVAKD